MFFVFRLIWCDHPLSNTDWDTVSLLTATHQDRTIGTIIGPALTLTAIRCHSGHHYIQILINKTICFTVFTAVVSVLSTLLCPLVRPCRNDLHMYIICSKVCRRLLTVFQSQGYYQAVPSAPPSFAEVTASALPGRLNTRCWKSVGRI